MANKLFIFGIGGTGERVMRSFTMMLASGVGTFHGYDIYPIIIDYDKENEDKRRIVELLQCYSRIHQLAFGKVGRVQGVTSHKGSFFSPKMQCLQGLDNYVYPFQPTTPNIQYREYIGFDNFDENNEITHDFLESLYYTGADSKAELNLDMEQGFRGNPNVGSVVFNTISRETQFTAFLNQFDPQNGDKVVIVGSIFGGTGASGIPEIVKAIKTAKPGAKPAVVMVLPYFAPEQQKDGAINAERFNSKTKAALNFYEDSGIKKDIEAIYYIGDFYSTVIPYSEGGDTQKNNANMVELLAAIMIEHFVAERDTDHHEFKFSVNDVLDAKGGNQVADRLFIDNFYKDLVSQAIFYKLAELAIGLKFFNDDIHSKRTKSQGFYTYLNIDVPEKEALELKNLRVQLGLFYNKFQEWLLELDFAGIPEKQAGNSHRLALCDMTRSYSDIIITPPSMKKPKGSLDQSNLIAGMNTCFSREHCIENKLPTELKLGHNGEWAFVDMLWFAAQQGLEMLRPNHPRLK